MPNDKEANDIILDRLREELSDLHSELRAETQRLNIRINEVERRIEDVCNRLGKTYRRTKIVLL